MTKFLIRWGINALALYLAVLIVPGIEYFGEWTGFLWLALIFGLLNALLRPCSISHLPIDPAYAGLVQHLIIRSCSSSPATSANPSALVSLWTASGRLCSAVW